MDVSMRKNVPRRLNSSNPIRNKAEVDFVPPEEDGAVRAPPAVAVPEMDDLNLEVQLRKSAVYSPQGDCSAFPAWSH